MKQVSVFRNGKELHSFTCERAEITGHMLTFDGVPRKPSHGGGKLGLYYAGGLYYFVDYAERTATVRPEEQPEIEIIVTW